MSDRPTDSRKPYEPEYLQPEVRRLLQRANREFEGNSNEAAAFRRLNAEVERRRPRPKSWRLELTIPLAAAALVALALGIPRLRPPPTAIAPEITYRTERSSPIPSAAAGASRSALQDSLRLQVGSHRLPDGTLAILGSEATAQVRLVPSGTRMTLESGVVELQVTKQAEGHSFEVSGGAYRFEVLGTVFKVRVAGDLVSLDVREGRVAVWKSNTLLGRFAAGERWDSRRAQTSAAPMLPLSPAASEPEDPDCLHLARSGQPRQAEQCFAARAAGAGLGAEMALYEVARLRRDVLANPQGALDALAEYRRRFPQGSLRGEADVSYLELLMRLGRDREALTLSDELLKSTSGRERAAELHVLRGNIYRKSLGDLAAAEREYATAEQLGGSLRAEATYLRGACLEALGDRDSAISAYERYLDLPSHPRADEVRGRLQKLSP